MKRPLAQAISAVLVFAACGGGGGSASTVSFPPIEPQDTLFVRISGGTFTNSSGRTVQVEAFSLMAYEVSNRLYANAAGAARVELPPDPGFPGMENYILAMPDHPVVNISPEEAEKVAESMNLRLPTRDEWEYAASLGLSGDVSGQFPWGRLSPEEAPGIPGNYLALDDWNRRDYDGFAFTAPSGSYPYSHAGLADMAGNVAEMVFDDSVWVLKGGSWAQNHDAMRIGWTRRFASGDRCWYAGFRLAR